MLHHRLLPPHFSCSMASANKQSGQWGRLSLSSSSSWPQLIAVQLHGNHSHVRSHISEPPPPPSPTGAEVIRMYEAVLGKAGFRKGMDLYFQRHDGQAVTCDDFLSAMADANGEDLSALARWAGGRGWGAGGWGCRWSAVLGVLLPEAIANWGMGGWGTIKLGGWS